MGKPLNRFRSFGLLVVLIASVHPLSTVGQTTRPNVVYFLVDNLGMGELSSYSGGPLRGVYTTRLDGFGKEGMLLLNFAPEAECTPSRSALMTGRCSIRSGNHTVALAGSHGGLVKWERTLGELVKQKILPDPALPLRNPHLINLDTDPKEREPLDHPYLHSWVGAHIAKILLEYQESPKREPLISVGAPLDFIPKQK